MIKVAAGIVLISASMKTEAQLIDNISTFRNLPARSYFRFHYDNDFFTKTDYYYTQGVMMEYVHPAFQNFFLSKVLLRPAHSMKTSGINFNLFACTPTSIHSDSILYGDRPYAAAMSFKIFMKAIDTIHQQQFASSLQIGVIGPLAQGKNIQTGIHRWLNNPLPKGWQYQVQNDIIINYQLNYEKKIADKNGLLLNATSEVRLGTLQDRLSNGINFMTGHFTDPYHTMKRTKLAYYLFGQGRVNLIGYDAMMQGGLFNRKNPYVISARDITRITFQADAGIILNFPGIYLSYTQSFLTKEFRTGRTHRWGGVSIGFTL
jgi:lipid A 3-O-deacylase